MFSSSKASRAIEKREGMAHWCWPQFVMTHEMCSACSTKTQIWKYGIIQTSPMVVIKRLKDLPTWLKVATSLEKPPTPTHNLKVVSSILANTDDQTTTTRPPSNDWNTTDMGLWTWIGLTWTSQYWFSLTSYSWLQLEIVHRRSTRIPPATAAKIQTTRVALNFDLSTHLLMLLIICAKYGKNPSRTAHAVEQTWKDVPYFSSFIAKSWLNDLENIGQGQRSLHVTHPLMLVIIYAQ